MRDQGLARAIKAVGGVGALARALGIAQPSVSGWTRIPADRVVAIEKLTGVSRHALRPDLFEAGGSTVANDDDAGIEAARANEYLLLAALLTRPPTQALLDDLAALKGDASPLGMAHIALCDAARATSEAAAGREYFNLFIGVGRGEVLPFASYYLTGFLNERPLARVREDLARLGIQRSRDVFEPEDHAGTLLEVMAGLIRGDFEAAQGEQHAFFTRHLEPWIQRLFADIAVAETADFYRAVADVGRTWIDIETEAFALTG